ncbi:unnamed protein product [Timema podura]|uniref:DUF5641 domain-containing protein n=1 Tax=Timema podura TaxID=61482 RepID=A0ABN7P1E4_TIMPD|nr:unnamed protein product [Timema podura]
MQTESSPGSILAPVQLCNTCHIPRRAWHVTRTMGLGVISGLYTTRMKYQNDGRRMLNVSLSKCTIPCSLNMADKLPVNTNKSQRTSASSSGLDLV